MERDVTGKKEELRIIKMEAARNKEIASSGVAKQYLQDVLDSKRIRKQGEELLKSLEPSFGIW